MTKEEKSAFEFAIRILMVNSNSMRQLSEMLENDKYAEGYADGVKSACDIFMNILEDKR